MSKRKKLEKAQKLITQEHRKEHETEIELIHRVNITRFKSAKQKDLYEGIFRNDLVIGHGSAGTGKSFVSI